MLGVLLATALGGLAGGAVLPAPMVGALVLGVLCIGLWATAVLPEYWTALAFFLAAVVLGIAPAETVFSGFRSSTFWLLFGGLVLGAAIRHTGLDKRSAAFLSRTLGTRYPGVILGIVAFGLALGFVMPSSLGRAVLMVPIVAALAARMGYGPQSNGRTGMLLAAAFGSHVPTFAILPSNVPNMILAGTAETLYRTTLTYWDYLLLHFPVLGLVKAALLVPLILWLFPDHDPAPAASAQQRSEPISTGERRLAVVLALSLVLWLGDGLHHVSPAWISLAAALYCLWPGSGLTSTRCINEEINHGSLLFVAGIMGLGAVIAASGLGASLVHALREHAGLGTGRPLWNVAALAVISSLVATLTTLPGVPAVMTPLADELARTAGLPLETVLMTQVLGFSNVLLPYQSPPLLAAIALGNLPAGAAAKLCLVLFLVTTLVLTPLDLLWWHLVGWL
ncbi:MAG: sodium:sulfate symporter [Hyphomicrobiaceae bacterium]|nr:MAG: sodium:sulfate symporter [Hyphomicrobiaceae bacterium]